MHTCATCIGGVEEVGGVLYVDEPQRFSEGQMVCPPLRRFLAAFSPRRGCRPPAHTMSLSLGFAARHFYTFIIPAVVCSPPPLDGVFVEQQMRPLNDNRPPQDLHIILCRLPPAGRSADLASEERASLSRVLEAAPTYVYLADFS
ncbi:hypothetical protein E2C01_059897 [Portunus trituberculatus]|uniref:Uncharacterized protein n=1 Tax=Portunus trituberculatus TaxID=210409 RepID=A0A5B7GZN7_PORTR|nr:hypothetical protein [Portunus trituberculatus]